MIDCPNGELRDVLPEYLHDRLEPRARTAVAAHLASCELCTAELALLRAAGSVLGATPEVDVGRIVTALPAPTKRPVAVRALPPRQRRVAGWRAAVAAAVAAAALLAAGLLDGRSADRTTMAPIAPAPGAPAGSPTAPVAGAPEIVRPVPGERMPLPELTFAGGVSDLTAGDLAELLGELDAIDALPAVEPQPVLLSLPSAVSGDD